MTRGSRGQANVRETAFPGEIELRFPYSRHLVDALKEEIPPCHRRWDTEEKVWRVTDPYREAAIELLVANFPDAHVSKSFAHLAPRRTSRRKAMAWPTRVDAPREESPATPSMPNAPDQTVIDITCPRCHGDFVQPIRVTAESSAKSAKRDCTPEFVAICPHCHALNVVTFVPAPSNGRAS